MMRGADQPFANNMLVKIAGVYLDVKMIDHTAEGHDGELDDEHIQMHRKHKKEQGKKDSLEHTFNGMKRKSCPGRSNAAIVMDFVHYAKHLGLMHLAM